MPDPTTDKNQIRRGGRGLMMHFINSVEYNDPGNCVTMRRTCQFASIATVLKEKANGEDVSTVRFWLVSEVRLA